MLRLPVIGAPYEGADRLWKGSGIAKSARMRKDHGMAQRVLTILVSDLTGQDIPVGDGRTVEFSVDGRDYRLDLSDAEARAFDAALSPYVRAAQRVGGTAPPATGRVAPRIEKAQLDAMRRWARANGYNVSDRGRISAEVQAAYHASTSP